jgi:hypothetical protein
MSILLQFAQLLFIDFLIKYFCIMVQEYNPVTNAIYIVVVVIYTLQLLVVVLLTAWLFWSCETFINTVASLWLI